MTLNNFALLLSGMSFAWLIVAIAYLMFFRKEMMPAKRVFDFWRDSTVTSAKEQVILYNGVENLRKELAATNKALITVLEEVDTAIKDSNETFVGLIQLTKEVAKSQVRWNRLVDRLNLEQDLKYPERPSENEES